MTPQRVLVVDEDPTLAELYRRALTNAGCDVVAVTDAQDALTKLGDRSFRVAVLDVGMPGIDHARAERKFGGAGLHLVFTTRRAEAARDLCDAYGCKRVLVKPFSLQFLVECVTGRARQEPRTEGGWRTSVATIRRSSAAGSAVIPV